MFLIYFLFSNLSVFSWVVTQHALSYWEYKLLDTRQPRAAFLVDPDWKIAQLVLFTKKDDTQSCIKQWMWYLWEAIHQSEACITVWIRQYEYQQICKYTLGYSEACRDKLWSLGLTLGTPWEMNSNMQEMIVHEDLVLLSFSHNLPWREM